jgi:hypothetical protein
VRQTRTPAAARQLLGEIGLVNARLRAVEAELDVLRLQRSKLLLDANRAGATYRAIGEATGLHESTVAAEIAQAKQAYGVPSLPKGRRTGISPKAWRSLRPLANGEAS